MPTEIERIDSLASLRDKALFCVLDSLLPGNNWGVGDYDREAPISTTLGLDLFLGLGVCLDDRWYITRGDQIREASLRDVVGYLNGHIGVDGSFGDDIWDAGRLGLVIVEYGLQKDFSNYPKLNEYLSDALRTGRYASSKSTWSGPGTVSVLCDYFEKLGDNASAKKLLEELKEMQSESDGHRGAFRGPTGAGDIDLASPVWHTSQAIMTCIKQNLNENNRVISSAVHWIVEQQGPSGYWEGFRSYEIYNCAYAIMMLHRLRSSKRRTLLKAVDWLNSQVASGQIGCGHMIVAAMALREITDSQDFGKIPLVDRFNSLKLRKIKKRYDEEIGRVRQELLLQNETVKNQEREIEELKEYKSKKSDELFSVSKKQAGIVGLIGAGIGIYKFFDTLYAWATGIHLLGGGQ